MRLPLETVLRRGQIAIAAKRSRASINHRSLASSNTLNTNNSVSQVPMVVETGPYRGLIGTMYHIIFEEGSRGESRDELIKATGGAVALKRKPGSKSDNRRKGQGLEGLWRGWRVGMWGLVGVWGAAIVGGGSAKGGEF